MLAPTFATGVALTPDPLTLQRIFSQVSQVEDDEEDEKAALDPRG
jgi:hypothetical protein